MGIGNFTSDAGAEYLSDYESDHVRPLIREIGRAMAGDARDIEPDEWEGAAVMCRVEILCCLAEYIGCSLPAPGVVAGWRAKYVAVWDGYMSHPELFGPANSDYLRDRRAVIVGTWDRLERLSRHQYGGEAGGGST